MSCRVQIVEESMEAGYRGTITGVVFFDFEDFQFPEAGWNDFIVVVLGWWLKALSDLERGVVAQAELRFMDGPYLMEITRQSAGRYLMACIADGGSRQVEYEFQDFANNIIRSALAAATKVQGICDRKGWTSPNTLQLNAQISLAKTLVALEH